MPDTISLYFWRDLARRYANHPAVLLGLYNEPHDVSWQVWREGGEVEEKVMPHAPGRPWNSAPAAIVRYHAVGLQELYDAVRAAGAKQNLVVVGGPHWSSGMWGLPWGDGVLRGTNVVYDVHVHISDKAERREKWQQAFLDPSRRVPILIGAWGDLTVQNGEVGFARELALYLRDNPQISWAAWDFHPFARPVLLRNWEYEPSEFGKLVKGELARPSA